MKDISNPLKGFVAKVQAVCDYCKDRSYVVEVNHLFRLSNSDDSVIGRIKQEDGKTVIYTQKRLNGS